MLRKLTRREQLEQELDEELRFHIDREIEGQIAAGMSPHAARQRARAMFGGVDAVKEECREARGTSGFESILQDVGYGARVMARTPGFTLTAVLTLAFTIGAVCTVLTLANTMFLRRLPVPRPAEVVEVEATRYEGTQKGLVSYRDYVHFRDATRTLTDLAAIYATAPLYVTVGDVAREVQGAVVSANFFPLLELDPTLGRFFRPDEDAVPDRDPVVVISDELWRTWFGAAPEAIGARIAINSTEFTVIGVVPPSFRGLAITPAQIYMPTMMLGIGYRWCSVLQDPDCTILRMLGRLAPGVGIEEVGAEMGTLLPPEWKQAPREENTGVAVVGARGGGLGSSDRQFVRLLSLVAGVLFLVCCGNLAGLLIARGNARTRELAIRTSLGAPRARLLRQLLTESMLLALGGGALGVLLSIGLTRLLQTMFFAADGAGRALYFDFALAPGVVLAVVLLSLLAGLLFGMFPALASVRAGGSVGLQRQAMGATARPGASRWLLGLQAASAVALVVVAALLASGAAGLIRGTNFDSSRVALMRLRPRLLEYGPEKAQRFLREVVARVEALPGVQSSSLVGTGVALFGFEADVATGGDDALALRSRSLEIGSRYFETLGISVVRGREFTARDDVGSPPVAVVSEALANRLWPGGDTIGSVVRIDDREHLVIGLVADVPLQSRAEPLRPYVYVPFWQKPDQSDARMQIRVAGNPAAMLPAIAREVRRVDPDVPVTAVVTLPARLAGDFRPLRMSAAAVAYAGVLAVILSAIGLYASLASAVERRTREIGVRQAIGASTRGIVSMITREGMTVIAAGVAAGLAVALISVQLIQHLLYSSGTGDAIYYALGGGVVSAVGLLACLVPARRAARIEPMTALRLE